MRFYRSLYRFRTARSRKEHWDEGVCRKEGQQLVRGHLKRHRSRYRPRAASVACRGAERVDGERLAARLAWELEGRNDEVRSLTFGAYLTSRWLPGKRLVLAATTYDGYRRNVDNHMLPTVGRMRLRRLRAHHLEALYQRLLHSNDGNASLAPKTVYEIHLAVEEPGRADDQKFNLCGCFTPVNSEASPRTLRTKPCHCACHVGDRC
jgi:hypothetical protein